MNPTIYIPRSKWTVISPIVTCYFSKIKRNRTYFSPKGVLNLREENIIDCNIRRILIKKGWDKLS